MHQLWLVPPTMPKSTKKAVLKLQNALHARVLPRIRIAKRRLKDRRLKPSSASDVPPLLSSTWKF
ncbi:hypothetical protein PVAP13_8KG320802 [Panicum virgatum]|uniref:Uncharacterized protein n=1 Tax=Panicum virgatum TaxID=38727 RepID=A0A8T0PNG1_PANVG|nr:hypothetical protein PVAP13_8KG320802 [Panicum virgatum]